MKIKHYVTAFANDLVKLDREVNELLVKGYQPYGNPYMLEPRWSEDTPDRLLACQAMVRYEEALSAGESTLI